jgi:hypothetical protein
MKPGGWILMSLSWAAIIGLAVFCFRRVLKNRDAGTDDAEQP